MSYKQIINQYLTPLSVIIAGIIIAGAVYYSGQSPIQAPVKQIGTPHITADITKVSTDGNPYIGSLKAPVTVAYWFDYQCPFCRRLEENVMPTIVKKYVDTGKIRIVFMDFQFLGQDSDRIGVYARAVWDVAPKKFYTWHKAIYDNQGTENTGWATDVTIRSITAKVLTNSEQKQVYALVIKNKSLYQQRMNADRTEGRSQGVSGTPSMLVGKRLIVGAQPLSVFEQVFDAALRGS